MNAMAAPCPFPPFSSGSKSASLLVAVVLAVVAAAGVLPCRGFEFKEATIDDFQAAFSNGSLTSRKVVEYYQGRIRDLNNRLHAVIEVNPDALAQADKADEERRRGVRKGMLHGIPLLLKDNIATDDKLNTTAGSLALLRSKVPRDAFVVGKLRDAGAVILGKASLSEWSGYRDFRMPPGWSARGGQGMNPYTGDKNVCGSSSGSAISVAANMVAVSLGTETDGSVLCPAEYNSVVGIKPTVGLTSRSGVVPISKRQDTVGVLARTVSDAVRVLDVIAGTDPSDPATQNADAWIPSGKYSPSLKPNGLRGKRVGILRAPSSFNYSDEYEPLFLMMRDKLGTNLWNISIDKFDKIFSGESGEPEALSIEIKQSLNEYLKDLKDSQVRSLSDVIDFNNNNKEKEMIDEYGQQLLIAAENSNASKLCEYVDRMANYSKDGLEKVMKEQVLDAVVTTLDGCSSVLAIGGFPGIMVPAGYRTASKGLPYGLCFGGLSGTEAVLIEMAYAFEQATKARVAPPDAPPALAAA